ncbi:hypothetical protein [Urechidicola vernalis]|uniref:Uncharacterized protein n=1 Tax=Urechidicola vernalis TaxID=3075600 RepID=A0ABU2Y3L5_9FLAO|nr:hypothetical protein [Urechidicola sp. P050]MDT0552627.1 hypothetical protein [Urechidicola sp. P050]
MKKVFSFVIMFYCLSFFGQNSTNNKFRSLDQNFVSEYDVDVKKILQIDELVYLKKDTTLMTGRVVKYNRKGKLKRVILVVDGMPDELGWIDVNFKNPEPGEDKSNGKGKILTEILKSVVENK